jgi:small-conductance mechanosensitive channel
MRNMRFAPLASSFFLLVVSAGAQEFSQPVSVHINGRVLFAVRNGVGSITPAERAQVVNSRLQRIVDMNPQTISTRLKETDIGWLVLVGDEPVISVTDKDAQAERLDPKALAEQWAAAIREGLQRATTERGQRALWRRIATTAAVLLLAFALLWILRWARRRAVRSLEVRRERVPTVRFRGLELLSGRRVHGGMMHALSVVYGVGILVVLTTALLLVFSQFPATREYAREVFFWTWKPLIAIILGVFSYLPNLFYLLVILVITRLVLRGLGFIFEQAHRGVISLEPWVHRDVARPTSQILKAIIIVIALFFIAPLVPGTGSTAAKGISVILGLMISFGSTSTVGNLIAGVVLTYMRPFQVGERVKLGDTVGDVIEKVFLYTKILTIKNEEVIVPSLQALSGSLINYSARAKKEGLILHTSVTIGYDAPWRRVHELLLQAAERTAGVLKEPKPFVLQTALNDFYVAYQLNVYTDQPNQMANLYAKLHENIQDAFNEGGIEICSPHYYQLRDGSMTTIPADYLKNYEPPRFLLDARVTNVGR